jgi:signal peptidase I
MQPTLPTGSLLWVQRGTDVRPGDIVVASVRDDPRMSPGTYLKRVIGLPGDQVACCDAAGLVTVNGKTLAETSYLYPGDMPSKIRFSVTLGPDQVWLMGDHRSISFDSREWGPVPEHDIVGRVIEVSGRSSAVPTTPQTFVSDGLAPPDDRVPLPLVLIGLAVLDFLVLLAVGIIGAIIRGTRRGREREAAAAAAASRQVI